ncbi:MAG: ParB/RepB/Spo0J family partition protein [Acidimicrobiales bacterium]
MPIRSIIPNTFQPRRRFDDEELTSLTRSVSEVGVLQPVLVRPLEPHIDGDRYELIAGERRWRAAQRAGLSVIPAIVRVADDVSSLETAVVENLHRADLNALEEAAAYRQLIDEFSLTQEDVARRVGKSRSGVANTLRLLTLPLVVQRLVINGALSAGHARALVALPTAETQIGLAERIVAEGLSVRQAETAARRLEEDRQDRPGRGLERNRPVAVLEVETLLADRLATRVRVRQDGGRGRVTIEFADLDDLERLARLLLP